MAWLKAAPDDTIADVKRMRRHMPWLLASLLALRALVPVGYMLHAPVAGDPLAPVFTMSLCPLQNPGLDLSLFETVGYRAGDAGHQSAHHGHHHAGDDERDGPEVRGFADSCTAWLGGAVALAGTSVASSPHLAAAALAPAAPRGIALVTAFAPSPPARAPPSSTI